MLAPAPSGAARPTKKTLIGRWIIAAAAKIGARVETDSSMGPNSAGCTSWRTKPRDETLSGVGMPFTKHSVSTYHTQIFYSNS